MRAIQGRVVLLNAVGRDSGCRNRSLRLETDEEEMNYSYFERNVGKHFSLHPTPLVKVKPGVLRSIAPNEWLLERADQKAKTASLSLIGESYTKTLGFDWFHSVRLSPNVPELWAQLVFRAGRIDVEPLWPWFLRLSATPPKAEKA